MILQATFLWQRRKEKMLIPGLTIRHSPGSKVLVVLFPGEGENSSWNGESFGIILVRAMAFQSGFLGSNGNNAGSKMVPRWYSMVVLPYGMWKGEGDRGKKSKLL
jgi:hypothetical protein